MNKLYRPVLVDRLLACLVTLLIAGEVSGSDDARPPVALADCGISRVEHVTATPESALELTLSGIVATEDGQLGYAIVRGSDDREDIFRTGDCVYGLATVEEIHVDRVIVRRNARLEVLRLRKGVRANAPSHEEARKKEARRIVTDFREKLLTRDGMALIRMFGFEETYGNGGFIGFTVKIVGEDGARMLEVLGLQEGDVITAVNGRRFSESLAAIESLATLKDASEVDVEIDRQGVPMFFHFEFDQRDTAGGDDAQSEGVTLGDAAVEIADPATH